MLAIILAQPRINPVLAVLMQLDAWSDRRFGLLVLALFALVFFVGLPLAEEVVRRVEASRARRTGRGR